MKSSAIAYKVSRALPSCQKSELTVKNVSETLQQKSITEKKLKQALRESEQRYAVATQVIDEGLWSWDLSCDRVDYSSRWKLMVGCSDEEIKNSPVEWLVRVHPSDIERLRQNLANCRYGITTRFEMEYALLHKDGQYRQMLVKCAVVTNSQGKVSYLIGSQSDITERQKIKAQLDYHAFHDRLTNLPNRQFFIEKLKELSQLGEDRGYCFGILYLDLDRFKNINHSFGNGTGDRLLIEIVRRLKSCLGAQDLLARSGGDEFAILSVSFAREDYACEVASRIQQEFSEPVKVGEYSILVSTSIGIAAPCAVTCCSSIDESNLIERFQDAEVAMQQAKAKGRACTRLFEPSSYRQTLEKIESENYLEKAIEQKQFVLHYQPIVKLEDHQLIGFEALIRWQHPTKGLIYPNNFIPLAENTGLIMPIGWWVLRCACLQIVQWQQDYDHAKSMFISVNITSKQLSQPYAGDMIAEILSETGLNPCCLKLEITESEIIENIALVLTTVEKLKTLGVQLSMDDFGTGYSSLNYLHCLPVDTLKIDRSFIQDLESDRHKLELVKTIIKLAEVFDLDIIAEGIESEFQNQQLIELQCKYGQGYLFSKPVPSSVAATLLSKNAGLGFGFVT